MESEIEQISKPRGRVWLARSAAVAADVLQIAIFPVFFEGFASPLEDAVDLVIAVLMILLVGWHIAFLPSFVIKLLPLADLAPTWTVAVLYVTRSGQAPPPGQMLNLIGTVGQATTRCWRPWYDNLAKPRWTPSPKTIGIVWTILYPIILISFGFVFLQAVRNRLAWAITVPFVLNLIANISFMPILFGLKNLQIALLDIVIVLLTIVWGILAIWPCYPAVAFAQLPYLLWVVIATLLQASITHKNPKDSA